MNWELGVGSGEVRVGSGEVGVGSGEVRVEGESSGELMVGAGDEQTKGDSDDEYDSTVKRVTFVYKSFQTIWPSENQYSFCRSQLSAQK